MRSWVIMVCALAGCGRLDFAPRADAAATRDAVGTVDAALAPGLVVHFAFTEDVVASNGARDAVSGVVAPCDVLADFSCPASSDDGPGGRRAASFDGVVDCLPLPYAPRLDLGAMLSIAAWVRLEAMPATGAVAGLVRRPYGDMFDDSYGIEVRDDRHVESTTSPLVPTAGTTLLALGAWTHVVSTWDGARVRLYLNGVQEAMRDVTTTRYDTHGLVVGCDIEQEVPDSFFRGALADVRVYDRPLTVDEITALAQ